MSSKNAVHRVWLQDDVEALLQWLEANKPKARELKAPQLCQEIKSGIERFRDDDDFSVTRVTEKFYNMRRQYVNTKKALNSTGHGVHEGTVDGRSSIPFRHSTCPVRTV